MEPQGDIALIGLAVMGQNLILNMNDHGYVVVAFNRTAEKVDDFLANEAKGTNVIGARSIPEMVALLKKPRRVKLMVKAPERGSKGLGMNSRWVAVRESVREKWFKAQSSSDGVVTD